MTPDPNSQLERQLWAAYRLVLQWPKREEVQRETAQPDHSGNDDTRADETQRAKVKHDAA
jgi:hypothetical protein